MSQLAKKVVKATGVKIPETVSIPAGLPGPRNQCYPLYGTCDLDDWAVVNELRSGRNWHEVQEKLHGILGITETIPKEKFRYHWLRGCACWPAELKR